MGIMQNLWVGSATTGYTGFLNNFESLVGGGPNILSDIGPNVVPVGTAALDTGVSKFGSGSGKMVGGGGAQYFTTNSVGDIDSRATGRSIRLEFWIYVASGGGGINSYMVSMDGGGLLQLGFSTVHGRWVVNANSNGPNTTGGFGGVYGSYSSFTTDAWHFMAIEKKWDDYPGYYIFSDMNASTAGVRVDPGVSTDFLTSDLTDINIGIGYSQNIYFDSVRFMSFAAGTEDSLLYQVSGFTVPTSAFSP